MNTRDEVFRLSRDAMDLMWMMQRNHVLPPVTVRGIVSGETGTDQDDTTWWDDMYKGLGDSRRKMSVERFKVLAEVNGFRDALIDIRHDNEKLFIGYHLEKGLFVKATGTDCNLTSVYLYGEATHVPPPEERWQDHLVGMNGIKLRSHMCSLGYVVLEEDSSSVVARHDEVWMHVSLSRAGRHGTVVETVTFEGNEEQTRKEKEAWESEIEWTNKLLPFALSDKNWWLRDPSETTVGFSLDGAYGLFNKIHGIESRGWRFNPVWEGTFRRYGMSNHLNHLLLFEEEDYLPPKERLEVLLSMMPEEAKRILGGHVRPS